MGERDIAAAIETWITSQAWSVGSGGGDHDIVGTRRGRGDTG